MTMSNGFLNENATHEQRAPRKSEPVSPMKIFAGLTLKNKNAREIPQRQVERIAESGLVLSEIKKNTIPIANATDEARPSMPSVRLAQLTMPRSNKIANG